MNKELYIGKMFFKKIEFKLYFNEESKKVSAKLTVNCENKEEIEKIVTSFLEVKDGDGYGRLSVKKLLLYAGIALAIGKPTMLVHASEKVTVISETEQVRAEKLEYNEDLIGSEIVLYGKDEVDKLFLNSSISKAEVLRILNKTDITPEMKGYIKEFIETVYQKEPDADMRIFAMNLQRNPLVYKNFDVSTSRCSPGENRIWFHRMNKELIFHELSHLRTLTYGESFVKDNPKARIKVVGNSFVNGYAGSGMREAYCVALNHRIGMEDTDYKLLYEMEQVLHAMFPEKMKNIETYNDYEGLKSIFLEYGLTSKDYDVFIGVTDTISRSYQNRDFEIDRTLKQTMMKPIATILMNKCLKEGLDYQEEISKISIEIPQNEEKEAIIDILRYAQYIGAEPTITETDERVKEENIGPAFDQNLNQNPQESEIGPGIAMEENKESQEEKDTGLFMGTENLNPDMNQDGNIYIQESEIGPGMTKEENKEPELQEQDEMGLFMGTENLGPAFDPNLNGYVNETETGPEIIKEENIGPAFDPSLNVSTSTREIGPGIMTEESREIELQEQDEMGLFMGAENIDPGIYNDFSSMNQEYYDYTDGGLRR